MSEPTGRDARSSPRIPVELSVSLVLAAADGPVVLAGHTVDVGLGGCRVALSKPISDDHGSGVIVLDLGDRDLAMLVAPVRLDLGPTRELSLRFLAPTEPDPTWTDFVEGLGADAA